MLAKNVLPFITNHDTDNDLNHLKLGRLMANEKNVHINGMAQIIKMSTCFHLSTTRTRFLFVNVNEREEWGGEKVYSGKERSRK